MDNNGANERRVLLAIVLSLAVYYLWMGWFAPRPAPQAEATTAPEQVVEAAPVAAPVAPVAAGTPDAAPVEAIEPHQVAFGTETWSGVVMSSAGTLRAVYLTTFSGPYIVQPIYSWLQDKVMGSGEGPWVPYSGGDGHEEVISPAGALLLAGAGVRDADGDYRVTSESDAVTAVRRTASDLVITKRYRRGDTPQALEMSVTFENQGTSTLSDLWIGMADEVSLEASGGMFGGYTNVIAVQAHVDGSIEHLSDFAELAGPGAKTLDGPVEWFGVGDRYFLSALVPTEADGSRLVFDGLADGRYGAFLVDGRPLAPGESRTVNLRGYLGPKDLDLLKVMGNELDDAVEYGFFGFFSKILLFLLKVLHSGVGNWGVAILLLTLFVKLTLLPLTQKSLESSRRMQQFQPILNELKEKYKDNRELQTQETMRVFKENKINPMGGCLPSLIQIPIWFALFRLLFNSVELYNSEFLYLRDLTAVDPYGALPFVVSILWVVQQLLTPMSGMDPTQQKMMRAMPIIFSIFTFTFPSGLVLYMGVNALLTIAQTWYIHRVLPSPTPAKTT